MFKYKIRGDTVEQVIRSEDETTTIVENTVMINAGLKSGHELASRLMEGEVFWSGKGIKIWYNSKNNSPFRFGADSFYEVWDKFYSLNKEVKVSELTLKKKLSLGIPVYAFVSQGELSLDVSIESLFKVDVMIRKLVGILDGKFLDNGDILWEFAREIDVKLVGKV